ncbi:EAL domain-containing protein [Shewanella marina]|uniref:EAL domain-containing protein n=1 Tax=Shewanella marina TaxID=487319 RepID=UPI00046FA18D|nr:EAL domain-containing protein [Shewanella marina]
MSKKLHLQGIEADYLRIVSEFAVNMAAVSSIEDILWYLAKNVISEFGFEDVVIYLLDEQQGVLNQVATYGNKNPYGTNILDPIQIKLGEGIVGKVAQTKKAVLVDDTRLFPGYILDDEFRLSELAVPMMVDDKLLGVIDSEHPDKGFYNQQHLRSLCAIGTIAATKINKAKILTELNQTIGQLEYSCKIQDSLFDIADLIFKSNSMKDFYQKLQQHLNQLTYAKHCYIAQFFETEEQWQCLYDQQQSLSYQQQLAPNLGETQQLLLNYARSTNSDILLESEQLFDILPAAESQRQQQLTQWLAIPFSYSGTQGMLVLQSYQDAYQFQRNDIQILQFAAKHIGNALQRMESSYDNAFLSLHDPLTKLPNRLLFVDRVENAMLSVQSDTIAGIAVLYVDVDRFKWINDKFGQTIGDELLVEIAKRIQKCLRTNDTLCRLGGDEFAILIKPLNARAEVKKIATNLLKRFESPFEVGKHTIKASISIGIACFDADAISKRPLLLQADDAMQQAKMNGRQQFAFYNGCVDSQMSGYQLQSAFNDAVSQRQLKLVFQPIINLQTDTVCAAEALIRWHHPEQGMISPAVFLPAFEQAGLLNRLDNYVVDCAIEFLLAYQTILPPQFKLSINISGAGFNSPELLRQLQQYYCQYASLLTMLCIEVTEQTVVSSVKETKQTMMAFRQMGLTLSLDDFGTGYSSLSYLAQYHFDVLKIDQSFINSIEQGKHSAIIIKTILSLADSLGIKTVAEGIETRYQYQHMQALNCQFGQGFLMSAGVEPEKLVGMVGHCPKALSACTIN